MFSKAFLKFGVVGFMGVIIDFFFTWLCKEKLRINKYLSNAIGFSVAVVNNFLWNRYWTFELHYHSLTGQFFRFLLISLAGLAINSLLLLIIVKYVNLNFYVTKLLVIGLVFFWNFYMNSYFTFI